MFLTWIISGLLSGLVASHIVNNHNLDVLSHLTLGAIGSLVGAFLFDNIFRPEIIGSHVGSVCISAIGSFSWLIAYYVIIANEKDVKTPKR